MSSKAYFDRVADQWDTIRQGFFTEAVREKALMKAGVKRGRLAVDVGAGTGFISEGLIQEGLKVIAVDQSEEMLSILKNKYKDSPDMDYRIGLAESLPIEDNLADYVFANMYLHHVQNPLKAIQEMARILKPGGMLVITDMDEHEFEFLKLEQKDFWMGFKREEVCDWFKRAGFHGISVDCAGEECCADSEEGSETAAVSIFMASGVK